MELIKQVTALPPQERTLFEQLLREMENGAATPGQAHRAQWPDFGVCHLRCAHLASWLLRFETLVLPREGPWLNILVNGESN